MIKITYHKSTKHWKTKMHGLNSINTSALKNNYCILMHQNKKSICSSCYAVNQEKQYSNVNKRYIEHLNELSTKLLSIDEIRTFKFTSQYIRFHSFGELSNLIHLTNFYNIAKFWSGLNFTLWTKRFDLISQIKQAKPKNLRLIYSNPIIDKKLSKVLPKLRELNFSGIFNVWSKKTAVTNNVKINCHKNCINCLLCYKPAKDGQIMQINEIIK